MDDKEKLLLAKIEDLFDLCGKYSKERFSHFFDEAERQIVSEYVKNNSGRYNCCFYGGYDEAERCMLGVFPEWEECDRKKFPVAVLKAEKGYNKILTHRDYLGTVLSLGIERSKIGDILVEDKGAFIFASEDIADFICLNIKKVSNCGVRIKRSVTNTDILPKRKYELINTVSASLRLDAVLAAALKISRRESLMYISGGRVSVNHKLILDNSFMLKTDDLMSVRGAGRIILEETGTSTKSGRIHIILKKCVR